MIESPLSILAYTSAWAAGYLFLKAIRFNSSRVEEISSALLVGLFLQSWSTFLLGLSGISLTQKFFIMADTSLLVGAALAAAPKEPAKRRAGTRPAPTIFPCSGVNNAEIWFIRTSVAIFALYFIMHMIINAERVVSFTDAVMSYDFRAKAIAYEGKVLTSVYGWPEVRTPNFMYPPLITLFNAHYYVLGGKNPKLIYSLILLATSGITASCVWRLSQNRIAAVLSACFMAFLPAVRKFSLLEALDFPALSFYTLGVTGLILYDSEKKGQRLLLSAVGFSGVAFLRPEDPVFFLGVLAVALMHFGIRKEGWKVVVILASLYAGVYGSHQYFVRILVGANPEAQLSFNWPAIFSPMRIFETLGAFVRHFSSDRFMLLGPFAIFLIVRGGKDTKTGTFLIKLLTAFCVSWITLLLIDNAGDWKEMRLEWSYFRIFIRITPLFILYALRHPIVLKGLDELFKSNKKTSSYGAVKPSA